MQSVRKSNTYFLIAALLIGAGAAIVSWQLSLNYLESSPRLVFAEPVRAYPEEAVGGSEVFVDVVLHNVQESDIENAKLSVRAVDETSAKNLDVPKEVVIGRVVSGEEVSKTVSITTRDVEQQTQVSLEIVSVVGDRGTDLQVASFVLLP